MPDGLPFALGDIGSESILDLGVDIGDLSANSVSGAVLANGGVGGAKLANNAVSGLNITAEYGVIGNGSPLAYGQSIQAGTGTLSAGSNTWQVFGKGFAAAPRVIVSNTKTLGALVAIAGSINAGSFYIEGATASDTFNWVAIGSGRP